MLKDLCKNIEFDAVFSSFGRYSVQVTVTLWVFKVLHHHIGFDRVIYAFDLHYDSCLSNVVAVALYLVLLEH